MGSDVKGNGYCPVDDGGGMLPRADLSHLATNVDDDVDRPAFTLEEAELLNQLLDSAGFKGSQAKALASGAQAKIEGIMATHGGRTAIP